MNKDEFVEYVESFLSEDKQHYTDDEIYEIGLEHKKLPRKDRSWVALAKLISWKGTSESLRSFINNRYFKSLDKEETLENDTTENIDSFEIKKQELQKEKQKVRDEWSTLRRTLRDEARIETIIQAVRESVSKLNSLPKFEYKSYSETLSYNNEAVLMLSDLHLGTEINNFYNTYNVNIAQKRLDKLANNIINYCEINKVYNLNILNLGDMISGIIHPTIRLEQEFDVVEQVMKAGELLSQFIYKLSQNINKVVYRSCTDNHSRVIANRLEHIEKEQFSKLIDWFLNERLCGVANIEFKNDNLDDSIGRFKLKNGKTLMFAHGHLDSPDKAFQNFIGATKEFVDYICLGHYHCEKVKSFQGVKVFVNGSIVGSEQYASSKRLFSNPTQTLLIFNREDDNVINISIDLT